MFNLDKKIIWLLLIICGFYFMRTGFGFSEEVDFNKQYNYDKSTSISEPFYLINNKDKNNSKNIILLFNSDIDNDQETEQEDVGGLFSIEDLSVIEQNKEEMNQIEEPIGNGLLIDDGIGGCVGKMCLGDDAE